MNGKNLYLTLVYICGALTVSLDASQASSSSLSSSQPARARASGVFLNMHAATQGTLANTQQLQATIEEARKKVFFTGVALICIGGVVYLFIQDKSLGMKMIILGTVALLAYQKSRGDAEFQQFINNLPQALAERIHSLL
jgi:Flp pilus assembly protein TadB